MKKSAIKSIEEFLQARYKGAATYQVAVVERRALDSYCVTIPSVGRIWIRTLHDSEKDREYIEYELPEEAPVFVEKAPETEQEMIARQVAKDAAKLTRQLNGVRRSGFPSSTAVNELLTINGLIEFGGPSDTKLFNHYRLTERALYFLKTGSMDGGEERLAQAA